MASGKEDGSGRKRDRSPEKPGKGKQTAKASPEDDRCPICLDKLADILGITPCHHRFCLECISKWATEGATICPVCRSDVVDVKEALKADDGEKKQACANSSKPHFKPQTIRFLPRSQAAPLDGQLGPGQAGRELDFMEFINAHHAQLQAQLEDRLREGQAAMARSRQAMRDLQHNPRAEAQPQPESARSPRAPAPHVNTSAARGFIRSAGQRRGLSMNSEHPQRGGSARSEQPPSRSSVRPEHAPESSARSQQPPLSAGIAPPGRYRVAAVPPLGAVRAAPALPAARAAAAVAAVVADAPGAALAPVEEPPPPPPVEEPPPPVDAPPVAPVPFVPLPQRFTARTVPTARAAAAIAAAMAE